MARNHVNILTYKQNFEISTCLNAYMFKCLNDIVSSAGIEPTSRA